MNDQNTNTVITSNLTDWTTALNDYTSIINGNSTTTSTTTTKPYYYPNALPFNWEWNKWDGYTTVYKIVSKQKIFAGIPKWKYVIELSEPVPNTDYIIKGWPWILQGMDDWIFIEEYVDDNSQLRLTFVTPLHVKIVEDNKIAPLNQFDKNFENNEVIALVNNKTNVTHI